MEKKDLSFASISELSPLIESQEVKPSELLESCIEQIDAQDSTINAFITTTFDQAREQASILDKEALEGKIRSPLHGIPIAIKDLFDLNGFRMTAGSKILSENISIQTAECIQRLIDSGAIILGKTNLQEFARGGTGANSYFGPSLNPWNLSRTPGGSSSGSAASVASGMAIAAIGSDTGGSVRLPASFCNLTGIRCTHGRISRSGAVPLGMSFDDVGPICRTIQDAVFLLQAMAGPDEKDPTTGKISSPDFSAKLKEGLEGLVLGIPTNHFWPGIDVELEQVVRNAISVFEELGAKVKEVEIPWAEKGQIAYAAVVGPESAEYHRKYLLENRDDYVSPGADFFEESLFVPGWRYIQAQRARTFFIRQAAKVFQEVDAILTPTCPVDPPTIDDCLDGMKVWGEISGCTVAFSTIGNPVLQVPSGFSSAGLPVGLQIAGKWGEEDKILQIGSAFEKIHPFWKKRPPVFESSQDSDFSYEYSPLDEIGDNPLALTTEDIVKMSIAIGYSVDPERLKNLTGGVSRLMNSLSKLDTLEIDNFQRADAINLLQISIEEILKS